MTDEPGASTPADSRCPWCSSAVPTGAERCPSCGAALREAAAEADVIPGVTAIDPVLGMRRSVPRPNRLVGWLADVDTEPVSQVPGLAIGAGVTGGAQGLDGVTKESVAPPSDAVRREIARLELDALKAELEARAAGVRQADLDAAGPVAAGPSAVDTSPAVDPTPRPRRKTPGGRKRSTRQAGDGGADDRGAQAGS